MKKELRKVVEIFAGYTFRESLQDWREGKIGVVQAKNIFESGELNLKNIPMVTIPTQRTNAFIQEGDVLFSNRGAFRSAVCLSSGKKLIASSSLYILRPCTNAILSEYISLFLNFKLGQQEIKSIITGATIKNILRGDLEKIMIPVPSLEKQKKIIEIQKNYLERKKLSARKAELQKNIADFAIHHLIIS